MDNNLDEILESGDEAAIEAALADMDTTGDVLFAEEGDELEPVAAQQEVVQQEVKAEPEPEQPAANASETDVENTDPSTAQQQEAATEENQPIETKNGTGSIPYSVLTASREDASTAKAALKASQAETESLKKQIADSNQMKDLYGEQLEQAGIELGLTPEQMLNDPKVMGQLQEDYPGIGDAVAAIAKQLQSQQAAPVEQAPVPVQAQESAPEPFTNAFDQSAHLKGWQGSNPERWQMAQQIDERLSNDPSFANKSISERFAETERRVMSAFGDAVPVTATTEQPAAITKTQAAPIPSTPSDLGHQGTDKSFNAQLLDQDAASMTANMANMSDADIEAALAEVSDFL